ncbi:hypothetical protein [Desulfuromonas sp. TF]|uniref:hypothetical protein n=1 Tax=Desulfuromonas sp. TF TaxID=1232410 RepID=UPI00041460C5|nr:hypothetical protein [Desulfuromonas sp. TF]
MGFWSVDANRCAACAKRDKCKDRRALLTALSPLVADLNLSEDPEEIRGDGAIVLACRGNG